MYESKFIQTFWLINKCLYIIQDQLSILILFQDIFITRAKMEENIQAFLNLILNINSVTPDNASDILNRIRFMYTTLLDPQTLSFALFRLAEVIMKSKQINQTVIWFFQTCICDIIEKAIQSEFKSGSEALRFIFDAGHDFYKYNGIDTTLKYPLGMHRKLNFYEPEVGEQVDVVKPYITSTSYCAWTRCKIINKQNKKYTIKYHNSDTQVTIKDMPFFDKIGSRTHDYEWRMNLQIGDIIDGFNKVWYPSTVVEVGIENGAKRVRVSFRRFSQTGEKKDFDGNKYNGLGPNEDDWIDVLSSRIQKPGKMAKQICYFSQISEQFVLDDTYDLIFQKEYQEQPFYGIMRTSFSRSVYLIHFINHFFQCGGNQVFLGAIRKRQNPVDSYVLMQIVLANTLPFVPRMAINRYLPEILQEVIQHLKENNKIYNPQRLDMACYFIDIVGKRLHTLTQKHIITNNLRKFLILEFVKQNLEKQIITLRYIHELMKPLKPYSQQQKLQLHEYFQKNQIFYKLIQSNVHEQILSRSSDFIRYMIDNKLIGWNQIEYIWNIIPHSDFRGRTIIQKLIGDISKDFTFQYTSKIIDKLLSTKQTQLTIDKLNLLRTLKDRQLSMQYKVKILNFLWECLTVKSTNIKQNVQQQIQNVFKGFISTIKEDKLKLQVLKAIIARVKEITFIRNQMQLFKEFILTYPTKSQMGIFYEHDIPSNITEVVNYLKKQNIYEVLSKLLALAKNKDKILSVLNFVQFIFNNDCDDVTSIISSIYEILGPSDEFLLWAKNITKRAINFFVEMYQKVDNMQKFEKISIQGLEAIKAILLDINVYKGNIKIIEKKKTNVVFGPELPPNSAAVNTIGTSTSDYSVMPKKPKDQILSFIFVLKSPFQCIGLAFLLQLLQYINSSMVYNDVIKLIIQFIVNLDDKIQQKTLQYRSEFLTRIFQQISTISKNNQFDNTIKLKLQIYLNLIVELINQTEKDGLLTLKPHFSTIQGQYIKLKITNSIIGNKLYQKQPYTIEVNDSMTLWNFKQLVAKIYEESIQNIDIVKYVNPIDDTNLGKSLNDIHFFNEQTIKVVKRQSKEIPRYDLLSDSGEQLSQKFNKLVEDWFNKYKNQKQLLGLEEFKSLSNDNWKGNLIKQEKRLVQILNKYDKDGKEALNIQQFKEFFIKKSKENLTVVWRLINLSGFKNNLRHMNQSGPILSIQAFPRRILSNRFVYDTIFQILSSQTFQPVHLNFYKFLTMIETDHEFCNILRRNIKDFLENQKCIYRLSYGIETLINELQTNLQLYASFYQQNGHIEIANKLQIMFSDNNKSVYSFDSTIKTYIIPNLLKILNLYIYPFVSQNKFSRFFKKTIINHLDISEMIKKLQKQQNYASGQQQRRQILQTKNNTMNKEDLYALAYKILQNLCINFNSEYLVKMSNQISRMFSFLFIQSSQFDPSSILNCANSGSLNLRRASHNIIYIYLLIHPERAQILLLRLIQNLPNDIKILSNSYYEILKFVMQKTIEILGDSVESNEFFTRLTLKLLEYFFKMPNQKRNAIFFTKSLDGILYNILTILEKKPIVCKYLRHIREELIIKGLFFYNLRQKLQQYPINGQMLINSSQPELFGDYVKCKSQSSRHLLMDIIFYLYKFSEEDNTNVFPHYILPILNQLSDNTKKSSIKSLYVGLNNLGSTCYMNSMLQVLNIVEPFRNSIMMTQFQTPLIKQLKSLFSYLFFSERIDYVPKALLQSFNPPINPGIQQDTTQFLNFLFDQLQFTLKGTPYENLLEQLFKGNQVAQMICHNCNAKRQRIQQFFTYSVQIEGKYDLHSALEGMHAGQLISDCLCQTCGQRSDTTKRNVLNEVPNVFFIHLKRIVFNYDIFVNTKIFTRLFFPEELNFQPYTKEGLELRQTLGVEYLKSLKDNEQERKKFEQMTLHGKNKEHYKLKLKGIIVHSGTPDVGHYYSILKRNEGWVKYDDSRVSIFPMMMFEQQCYGGTFIADEWGGNSSSKNAYVLIYQKQHKADIKIKQIINNETITKSIPFNDFKTYNTVQWYKQVWFDNHILMLEQQLVSDSYNKQFLSFICKMLQISQSNATLDIISQIFFKISLLSGQVGNLVDIFLKNTHLISFKTFEKYIISDPKRTFNLLFHHQHKVRDFASIYIQRILIICYKEQNEQNKQKIIAFLIEYLKNAEGEVAKNWMRIDGYFKLFQKIVYSSVEIPSLYNFIISQDLIYYFIDFIMEKQSPLQLHPKKFSLGTKSNPTSFSAGLNFISFLIQRSFGFNGANYQVPSIPEHQIFHLSDNAVICLSSMAFYQKMIKENQNANAISTIIQRLSIQNQRFSQSIARILLKLFNQNTDVSDELDTVMLCISKFLRIRDSLWLLRAQSILGTAAPFIYDKNILSCIDEEKYVYPSTLQNIFPLESLISYAHINRNRAPLTVINMIKTILEATSTSDQAMDYLIKQPAPSYLHLRLIDWIRSYVNQVVSTLTIADKKKEEIVNKISICNLYLDDLFKRITKLNIPYYNLVIGQIGKKILVDSFTDNYNQVQINIYNVPVWGIQSLPNGKGNSTFDQYLNNGRLEAHVTENSNILKFFKHSSKPLAIKNKNVQEDQDIELRGLFDEDPYPKKKEETPMQIEVPKQNQKINEVKISEKSQMTEEKVLEPIPEIIYNEINLQNARQYTDYLSCLQVINNTENSKVANLTINHFQNTNSMIPYNLKIMVNKTKEEYWFTKAHPYEPKGQFNINLFVTDYVENLKLFCKIYGNQPIIPIVQIQPQEPIKKQEETMQNQIMDQNADVYEEISCSICTFLNPKSNNNCQICGEMLK